MFVRSLATIPWQQPFVAGILAYMGLLSVGRINAQVVSVDWKSPTSGLWNQSSNWSTGVVPQNGQPLPASEYDVTVGASGTPYTVTLQSPVDVRQLTVNSAAATVEQFQETMQVDKLDIRSGTYRIRGYASLDADEILINSDGNFVGIGDGANPKIFNAVIRKESGVLTPGSLAVEGVTFASDLRVVEQLQFHGDLRLAEGATLNVNGPDAQVFHWPFEEAGNLVGNGKIVVQGGSLSATKLEPGVTITVQPTDFRKSINLRENASAITIAEGAFASAEVQSFTNSGTMTIQGGFGVNSPTFKNTGTILLGPSASLSIGSTVTMADLGDLRDQTVTGQVTVRKLDNRGQTLDLAKLPFRNPEMFFGISGGRIDGPGNYNIGLSDFNLQDVVIGADLTLDERVFLDNVTLDDVTLTFTSGGSFQLVNELKGKGVIHMEETASMVYGSDATLPKDIRLILDNSQRVGLYRNLGTIEINRGNQVGVGINEGTINVKAPKDSRVYLGADTNWANRGTIRQISGNLEFFGNYSAAAIGNFIREGGELFYGGVYDNQDATLHLDNTTGFNGEILAGRIEVAPGQAAKAAGFVRGASELSGTLRIYSESSRAELDVRRMKLDNGRIEIPRGELYFESITGAGSIMIDGLGNIFARTEVWTLPPTMTLETGPELGGYFSSPVVSEGTVRVRPGTGLNMIQFANRHEVRVEQNGRLGVHRSIDDSSAPAGHWQIETNGQVEFYLDATLQPQDHWTYQIGTATNRPMIRGINSVNIAGDLEVVFADDYRVRTDDAFRLLQATALSGKFSQLTLPDLPPSFQWNTSELESTGWLRVNGPAITTTVLTAMVEPPLNANSFVPAAGQKELGFRSQFTNTGTNPLVGVTADAAGKRLTHRSVTATTQFDSMDLSTTNFVELEVQLAIASTGYEEGDFVEVFAIHGGERVDIVNLRGTPLNNATKNTVTTYSAILPDTWADATLYFKSNSNSTGGSEAYHLYRASIAGYPLDSSSGDFDRNGALDGADVDQLSRAIALGENSNGFDLNKDNLVSQVDLAVWVSKFKHTTAGDANLDGAFNSADLVAIFQAGQYEDAIANNSGWATGDWNADLEFTSSDLLVAFQAGGYEEAVAGVRAIPEPALSSWIVLVGSLMLSTRVRRVRRPGDSVGRCGGCKNGHRG